MPKVKFNENVDVFHFTSLEHDHYNSGSEEDFNTSNRFGSSSGTFGYNLCNDDFNNSQTNHDGYSNGFESMNSIQHLDYTCMNYNDYNANNYAGYDQSIKSLNQSNENNNHVIEVSSSEGLRSFETIDRLNEHVTTDSSSNCCIHTLLHNGHYHANICNEPAYNYNDYLDNDGGNIMNEGIMIDVEDIVGPTIVYDDDEDTWWDEEIEENVVFNNEDNEIINYNCENNISKKNDKTSYCNDKVLNKAVTKETLKNVTSTNQIKNIKGTRVHNSKSDKENKNGLASKYNNKKCNESNCLANHSRYSLKNKTNNIANTLEIVDNEQKKVFNHNRIVSERGMVDRGGVVDLEKPVLNVSRRLLEKLRRTKLEVYPGGVVGGREAIKNICQRVLSLRFCIK